MTIRQIWQNRQAPALALPEVHWRRPSILAGRDRMSIRGSYGTAAALSVIVFFARILLHPYLGPDTPITLSIVAVAVAARIGGVGPGLFATALSFFGAAAFFMPPWSSVVNLHMPQFSRLLVFVLTGVFVSLLTEALNRTQSAYVRSEQEQENRILQERNRMAREIHDTLAQGLTGIIIQLEAADDLMSEGDQSVESSTDAARAHITRAHDLARHSLSEARRSVQALRPQALEERDLFGALAHSVEQMTAGTGIRADVTVEGTVPVFLTGEIQSHLLRIGVEAVTNALKHARAERISLHLCYEPDRVTLAVKDDGRGFTPHTPQTGAGFGLTGMWERTERIGGQFTLASRHGGGTEITVTVAAPVASVPGKAARR